MSPQAGWILQEEVVPRLRSAIPRAVSFVGSEDAEELIQDATAMAAIARPLPPSINRQKQWYNISMRSSRLFSFIVSRAIAVFSITRPHRIIPAISGIII
jgi:hypothetical protein